MAGSTVYHRLLVIGACLLVHASPNIRAENKDAARPAGLASNPPLRGMHEGPPCLSHDGRTLAWFHREDEKAYLCVLKSPWDKPPRKVAMRNSQDEGYRLTDCVQLSGDGRHAFVNGQHVEIVDGKPIVRGVLPGSISPFGVAASFDGSQLAALIGGRGKGVRLLSRTGARYVQGVILTPPKSPHPARNQLISADGKVMVCELGINPHQAVLGKTGWRKGAITHKRKIGMIPLALSSDGQTLLLQGVRLNPGRTVENI